jgi:hypothetical protein
MKITAEDMIERLRFDAQNPKRILTESRGDTIEEDIDYELPGLTPGQIDLMEAKIDDVDLCTTMLSSCRAWFKANDTGMTRIQLERRSDNQIRAQLINSADRKSNEQREKMAKLRAHNKAKRHAA